MNQDSREFPHRRLFLALASVVSVLLLMLGEVVFKSYPAEARGVPPAVVSERASAISPFLLQANSNLQWTQTAGPYSGFMSAFGSSGTILFAGTEGAGVFRSTDGGQNWIAVNTGLTNRVIRAFAVLGTNVFVGTEGGGVFRSADNGASWVQVNSGLLNLNVRALAVNGTGLLAATLAGVFSSTNNGQSWSVPITNSNSTAVVVSGSTIYVGTDGGGVQRSVNNGLFQTISFPGLTNPAITALTISGGVLFAGTGTGVFRLSENDQLWTRVNTGLSNTNIRGFTVSGTSLFAATDGGVFQTTNAGSSWSAAGNGLTNSAVRAITVNDNALFAGTFGGGVFRSAINAVNWTPVNNGIFNSAVRAFVAGAANVFAGTEGGGVFRSGDSGQTWTQINNGLTNTNVRALVINGTTLFAGTFGGGIFRSTDNGQTWAAASNGLTSLNVRSLFANGTTMLAGTDGNVFRSTDNGQSWAAISPLQPILNVEALLMVGSNIFAGTEGNGAFRLNDNGTSWSPRALPETNIRTLTLLSGSSSIYAGTDSGVFLSTDNGERWTAVSNGLTTPGVRAFAVNGNSLFAGTNGGGVFRSTNGGQNWTPVNSGLSNTTVRALLVYQTNLLAGTIGSGAFTASLTDCTYAISPDSRSFGAEGGPGSVTVTTAGTCDWTAVSNADWIVINSGAKGTGAGVVNYSADANSTANARTGTVTIAGKTFSVTQSGLVSNPAPTLTSISPNTVVADGPAFTLTATGTGFNSNSRVQWNGFDRPTSFVSSTQLTATIPAADIVGNGTSNNFTAGVSVFNPVPGGGTSASQRMTITPACSYVLSPSLPPNIGVNGGTASVRVTTTGGCAWTASSDTPWLKITSGASNTGTGNVSYSAEANPDASPRTGNMTIAGQSFTVTQSGSRGNPSPILDAVMPASVIAGGLGFTLTVTGSNFVANSVVNFRNSARPTTYISDTKLTARISATDISGGGSAAISVTNFASSGGTSSAVNLVIDPRPSITEAEPNDLPSQAQSIQIPYLINGTAAYGDWAGLVYSANGEADPIEDLYALTLPQTAQLDIRLAGNGDVELDLFLMRDDGGVISFLQRSTGATGSERIVTPLMPPGRYLVGVSSLSGAGTYQLQVGNVTSTTAQTPTITNAVLAPSLVVYGANFQSNSVIKINGVDAATTPISSTQLSASASGQAVNRVTVVSPNQPIGADQSNEVLVFPNSSGQRLVRVGNVFNTAQNAVKIPIELLALGGENSISFSVRFNKDLMTYRSAELAAGLNATLSVNTNQRSLGSLGFTITLPTGQSFLAGTRQLLSLNFTATPGTGGNITTLAFDDQPVTRSSVINFKTAAIPINQANGLPSLSGISPIEAKSGGEAFTLSVNGANFVYNSVVRWQGGNRTTSFVSPTQLTATIAAGDLLSVGTPAITVFNPAPGGGESNPLSFTINQFCNYVLQPTAQSFSGDGGTGSFSVTVTSGCEWTASGNANWIVITSGSGNGNGTVTFSIEPNPTTNQRSGVITVGGQSFNITQAGLVLNPPPTLSSLAPASVAGGGAAFTLSVSGANFVQSSVIQWNGENRPTVFVSGRQLNAQISAGDIAVAGTVKIAVFNPTPGGGRSAELPFSVTCGYTVQPTAQDFAPAGGSGTVRVSAPTGCAWTAAGNVSWIKVVSGANGSGAGEAVFSVEANTGAARTGTLTIAGEVFTVRQDCIVTAILTQPVSQTVCAGAPVTFSVMATSALPVSYQWRKNGVNLPAATSANFTIASAAASDAGDYSVVVAGACGTVTSSVATLIVNTPPVITSQPVNQIAPPGAGVTFTAAATGNPAPTVQWQVSADGVNFSNLPGATGSVLTLPNLTLALNGNRYRAVFANTCATVPSNVVTLTVACPTITLDPTSLPAATVGLPYNQPITAGGGSAPYSFSLNAQIPGLTLSASGALTGTPTQSGAFSFRVTATDANGCTAGRDYTLTASCIYDIAPQEQSFAAGGGNGSLTVTTAGGCAWQAVSNVSWIRITSGGGAGPGIVTFTVDANTEAARTGTLTVAGRTFTVRQACVETAIIAQPVAQTVCAGASVRFAVTAVGATPISYQWRKNGLNIAGANSAVFTISSASANDAGDYSVLVAGACGNVVSGIAALTVNTPPVITAQPANQAAPPGTTAIFTAAATGSPAPTVQWQVSSDGVNFSNIPGATGTTLTVNNITLSQHGNRYRAVFTNICAPLATNAATLSVACPTIELRPASLANAITGTPYSQTFTAVGGVAPYNFSASGSVPGLSFSPEGLLTGTPTQGGSFSLAVTVTDVNGCAISKTYSLTVLCAYALSPQARNFTAIGGTGSVALTTGNLCGWTARSNISWIRITSGISGSGPATISYVVDPNPGAARSGTLTIAEQTFTVTQDCTTTAISAQPVGQTVCAGAPVTFSVGATGAGSLTFQWRKNGVDIPGATEATYGIPAAQVADAGGYTVVVTGICGSQVSNIAALTVNTPPNITTEPANQTIAPGQTATFNAVAAGSPTPTVQWQVSADGVNFSNVPGANAQTLTINNAVLAQTGNRYRAVFTNSCGQAVSRTVTLTIACPAIRFSPDALANGTTGASYSQLFTAGGGTAPYVFSLNPPIPGLNLITSGPLTGPATAMLMGTPTQSGTFSFTLTAIDANGCAGTRTYSLTIICAYDIAPRNQTFTDKGGAGTVAVTTGTNCTWAASSNAFWLRITSGESGTGPGQVVYEVAANPGTDQRIGLISVAGQTFTVTQAGVPPNPRPTLTGLSPGSAKSGGEPFALRVFGRDFVRGAVIRWNGNDRITNFESATEVNALIPASDILNPGTATITVFNPAPGGGVSNALSFTITQLVCNYAIQPSEQTFTASGGNGTVAVSAGSECTWTATSNAQWITITSGASGTGAGTVSYRVEPNTGAQRSGLLTIAGKTFTVTQGCTDTVIAAQPVGQTVCAGAAVTFSVTAGGAGTLSYQWRKNGLSIAGATGSTYTLLSVSTTDAGNYTVVVTGACNNMTSNVAILTVNSRPAVTTQPVNQTVAPGGSATFTAAAGGNPAPTVQWQVSTDGVNFVDAPGGNSETLVISNVTPARNGNRYRAVFNNSCGPATSNVVTLNVTCPIISITPATLPNGNTGSGFNQTLSAGGGAGPYVFSVSAGNLPPGVSLSAAGVFSGTPVENG
ncbi:MAG TPA: immunoglobulin domain-containing protein, partial [Blastocatellia bacterium]|nr:immunoglobulin domain-containing protein [Blastocatellia bacterium]